MNKLHKISPNAILLLKDTLSIVFWYKKSLADYLKLSVSNGKFIISQTDWKNDYKRNTVSYFVDYLVKTNSNEDLVYIIGDLSKKTDFNELKKADNYGELILKVQNNIQHLKEIYKNHVNIELDKEKREIAKEKYQENIKTKQYFERALYEVKNIFFNSYSLEPIPRGFEFEKILKKMNDLFDLDAKGSYRINNEQIDGSFSLDGTDYILEAKWYKKPIDHTHIIFFIDKIRTKLDNTLGLFISHSAFTDTAIQKANQQNVILMDGEDLLYVLENKIDYLELLRNKKRHAAETGESFLSVKKMIF